MEMEKLKEVYHFGRVEVKRKRKNVKAGWKSFGRDRNAAHLANPRFCKGLKGGLAHGHKKTLVFVSNRE